MLKSITLSSINKNKENSESQNIKRNMNYNDYRVDYSNMTRQQLIQQNIELKRQRDMYYQLYINAVNRKDK